MWGIYREKRRLQGKLRDGSEMKEEKIIWRPDMEVRVFEGIPRA